MQGVEVISQRHNILETAQYTHMICMPGAVNSKAPEGKPAAKEVTVPPDHQAVPWRVF